MPNSFSLFVRRYLLLFLACSCSIPLLAQDDNFIKSSEFDDFRKDLWTWYDNPASAGIPNTNNGLEGKFTDLKTKLRNHNGLSKKHRMIFIDHYFKGSYK